MDNVEATIVPLTVGDNTDTAHIAAAGDHGNGAGVEGDVVGDLAGLEVDLDGVVDLDGGVGVSDAAQSQNPHQSSILQRALRAGIVGDEVWDSLSTELNALDLGELVLSLLGGYPVDGEATLGVVDQPESLASLLDADDIHETSRVCGVRPDLSVNLHEPLHENGLGLAAVQGILEPTTISAPGSQFPPSAPPLSGGRTCCE